MAATFLGATARTGRRSRSHRPGGRGRGRGAWPRRVARNLGTPIALAIAAPLLTAATASAQFDDRTVGQYYRIELPRPTQRNSSFGVRVERLAPGSLAMPAPLDVISVPVPIRALNGRITELPRRGRIYFTVYDAAGAARLLELDLIHRESRLIGEPPGSPPAYDVELLVSSRPAKIYVRWIGPGQPQETQVYDGETLRWLEWTAEFEPNERAAGFEAREPFLWTLDPFGNPVLVDAQRDRVEARFDHRRWLGDIHAAVADAWRDVLLYRIDAGHDRYQLIDVRSGEIGPPLDLEGYGQVQPRLAFAGRVLVNLDIERRPLRSARRLARTAIALGTGQLYDLRDGTSFGGFRVVVPPDLPVASLGTTDDPALPGRLWVHTPIDDERIDLDLPDCRRGVDGGDEVAARLDVAWGRDDPGFYRYRLRTAEASRSAIGALAIRAGRATDQSGAPEGWGMDLIDRERWLRWTNALGPAEENIAPGEELDGFVIAAERDTRPGIVEYRVQAALGLSRGCESDRRFLENSWPGYTIAPESVDPDDAGELAERLGRLVERACEIDWIDAASCPELGRLAESLADRPPAWGPELSSFREALAAARTRREAEIVLADAERSIREAVDPGS